MANANFKLRQIINQQLPIEIDLLMIGNGLTETIDIGETDYNGDDVSLLQAQIGVIGFSDYTVYQSRFKNWLWEKPADINDTLFSIPSNSVVVEKNSIVQTHNADYTIDYYNGRILFTSPLSPSDVVQASFTYKKVFITFKTDKLNLLVQSQGVNQEESVGPVYPTEDEIIMPAVFIDTFSRTSDPMCLGTTGKVMKDRLIFNVYSEDRDLRDKILDILSYFEDASIDLIDWENAPLIFTDYGDISPTFTSISFNKANFMLYRTYFKNVNIRNINDNISYSRGIAEVDLETWIFATPI